jgi:D-serine dehydratase
VVRLDSLRGAAQSHWVREAEPIALPDVRGVQDVIEAIDRWRRFAPALALLFKEQIPDGIIESPLRPIPRLAARYSHALAPPDLAARTFVKADHALPLAGSIKARGGLYAVLCIAERAALEAGLLRVNGDYSVLTTPAARQLFSSRQIIAGSTGNLGFAVGLVGRALGFETIVHMSHDAKAWKKERLKSLGVSVVEHRSDYSNAVAAARQAAQMLPHAHFIDDERSADLFFGYSAAAGRLAEQLAERSITIDADRPLCVYLPCGVGGAPAGVLFGLRALMGPHVWGFFAEPTASPCMLMRLMGAPATASVYDLGLDNQTIADGLAVARASDFAFQLIGAQVMGGFTITDAQMLSWVAAAWDEERLRLEPSAAAGFPVALQDAWRLPAYAARRARMSGATHVIWTTGGALMPDEEFARLLERAATARLPG